MFPQVGGLVRWSDDPVELDGHDLPAKVNLPQKTHKRQDLLIILFFFFVPQIDDVHSLHHSGIEE